jgi:hypothetical protein
MAVVKVWRPKLKAPDPSASTAADKIASRIENVGHAALLCDRSDSQAYVSFWPDHAVGLDAPAARSFTTHTEEQDIESEGEPPIDIPLDCLEDSVIASWWSNLVHNKGMMTPYSLGHWPRDQNYHLYRTNCSSVVAHAMRLGGADKYMPLMNVDRITPIGIESWARQIQLVAGVRKRLGL